MSSERRSSPLRTNAEQESWDLATLADLEAVIEALRGGETRIAIAALQYRAALLNRRINR